MDFVSCIVTSGPVISAAIEEETAQRRKPIIIRKCRNCEAVKTAGPGTTNFSPAPVMPYAGLFLYLDIIDRPLNKSLISPGKFIFIIA